MARDIDYAAPPHAFHVVSAWPQNPMFRARFPVLIQVERRPWNKPFNDTHKTAIESNKASQNVINLPVLSFDDRVGLMMKYWSYYNRRHPQDPSLARRDYPNSGTLSQVYQISPACSIGWNNPGKSAVDTIGAANRMITPLEERRFYSLRENPQGHYLPLTITHVSLVDISAFRGMSPADADKHFFTNNFVAIEPQHKIVTFSQFVTCSRAMFDKTCEGFTNPDMSKGFTTIYSQSRGKQPLARLVHVYAEMPSRQEVYERRVKNGLPTTQNSTAATSAPS
jgi:hypothetical protein